MDVSPKTRTPPFGSDANVEAVASRETYQKRKRRTGVRERKGVP